MVSCLFFLVVIFFGKVHTTANLSQGSMAFHMFDHVIACSPTFYGAFQNRLRYHLLWNHCEYDSSEYKQSFPWEDPLFWSNATQELHEETDLICTEIGMENIFPHIDTSLSFYVGNSLSSASMNFSTMIYNCVCSLQVPRSNETDGICFLHMDKVSPQHVGENYSDYYTEKIFKINVYFATCSDMFPDSLCPFLPMSFKIERCAPRKSMRKN